jgi:hypothetical protein
LKGDRAALVAVAFFRSFSFAVAVPPLLVLGRILVHSDGDLPTAYNLAKQVQITPFAFSINILKSGYFARKAVKVG